MRDDFAEFVQRVRALQPDTPIVFLSIKPSADRWAYWPQMQAANELIRRFAREAHAITCVDVATPLLGTDGRPRPELYLADKLHLNDDGYRVWEETLGPVLAPLLRAPPATSAPAR